MSEEEDSNLHVHDFATLTYRSGDPEPGENLQAGIAILTAIQDAPWAEFLHLRDLYIPLLTSIAPDEVAALRAVTGPDLVRDPGDYMARIVCPVLAFFGENDVIQSAERSAVLFARHFAEANEDVKIVVIQEAGHNICLSTPEYAGVLTDWLASRFAGQTTALCHSQRRCRPRQER